MPDPAFAHFARRVAERIGPVDPATLRDGLVWAIRAGRRDLVRPAGRVSRTRPRRLFAFVVPDGRWFWALVDTDLMLPITVFPEGMTIARQGRASLTLRCADA